MVLGEGNWRQPLGEIAGDGAPFGTVTERPSAELGDIPRRL